MPILSKSLLAFLLAAACAAPSSDDGRTRARSSESTEAASAAIGRAPPDLDAVATTCSSSAPARETFEPHATIEAGGSSSTSAAEEVGDVSLPPTASETQASASREPHAGDAGARDADAHASDSDASDGDASAAHASDGDASAAGASDADARAADASSATEAQKSGPWLTVDRGPGQLALLVPRAEDLGFRVIVDVGILGEVEAGKVVLSAGVERYVSGLPPARGGQAQRTSQGLGDQPEIGWLKSRATGGYGGYTLEHELQSRVLPQVWPRVLYTDTQSGSENRKRELRIGLVEGRPTVWYRNDGHCKGCENPAHFVESRWMWGDAEHCKKCKRSEHRLWRPSATRDVPAATVDMLSAVYLARTMVREGIPETAFPLIDKQKLWNVKLQLGRRKRIETPAGRFDAREVKLSTSRPPSEPVDEDDEGFEGMFGIRGTIQIWLEARSGVPVLIAGDLPVPVLGEFDVRVELVRYEGTPEHFGPIE